MSSESSIQQEIEQRAREFEAAFNRGDMATLAGLYTEDAHLLPPGSALAQGRPGIQQFWQGAWDSGIKQVALHPHTIVGGGDMAYEVSTATLTIRPNGGQESTVTVKYVVVYRRSADGQWQMAADIWNSDT